MRRCPAGYRAAPTGSWPPLILVTAPPILWLIPSPINMPPHDFRHLLPRTSHSAPTSPLSPAPTSPPSPAPLVYLLFTTVRATRVARCHCCCYHYCSCAGSHNHGESLQAGAAQSCSCASSCIGTVLSPQLFLAYSCTGAAMGCPLAELAAGQPTRRAEPAGRWHPRPHSGGERSPATPPHFTAHSPAANARPVTIVRRVVPCAGWVCHCAIRACWVFLFRWAKLSAC